MSGRKLFEQVVDRTGLASFIGPGAVERALANVGASPEEATFGDFRRALPQLHKRMSIYLKPPELDERLRAIEQLLGM